MLLCAVCFSLLPAPANAPLIRQEPFWAIPEMKIPSANWRQNPATHPEIRGQEGLRVWIDCAAVPPFYSEGFAGVNEAAGKGRGTQVTSPTQLHGGKTGNCHAVGAAKGVWGSFLKLFRPDSIQTAQHSRSALPCVQPYGTGTPASTTSHPNAPTSLTEQPWILQGR